MVFRRRLGTSVIVLLGGWFLLAPPSRPQRRFSDGEIYLINVDGSGLRRLTHHPGIDARPNWCPDGKRIVFERAELLSP